MAGHGIRPDRGGVSRPAGETLPAELVQLLIDRVGVAETEIAAMTKDQAVERLNRYWIEGR